MGLVIQDGKLLIKPMLDGDGNPVLDGNGNPKNALATATRPSEACDCCTAPPDPLGACCYLDENSDYQCKETTQQGCADLGGSVWYGGQKCKSDENPDGIDCDKIPDPQGACCYLDDAGWQCENTIESRCDELNGTWHEGVGCKSDTNPDGIDCEPVAGKCCSYPYSSSGPQTANTAGEARQLAAQSAKANSAAISNSIWTIGTPAGVPWVEGGTWYDEERNQYVCAGYWTQGNQAVCTNETQEQCSQGGPFKYFTPGETCEDAGDCPENPPEEENENPGDCGYCIHYRFAPGTGTTTHVRNCVTREYCQERADSGQNVQFFPWECVPQGGADFVSDSDMCADGGLPCCNYSESGICIYREDGLGTCSQWLVDETGNCDYESAEAAESGAANDAAFYTDGAWWYVFPSDVDDISEGWCYRLFYRDPGWGEPQITGTSTEENCKAGTLSPIDPGAEKGGQSLTQEEVQSAYDELVGSTWENDQPADKCKIVNSPDECTESTGVFCPGLDSCPEDLSEGCPEDPGRSNPLP